MIMRMNTILHTCGCYAAIVPTSFLPRCALPEEWKDQPLKVYGETLPQRLDYRGRKKPKLLVHLRPAVHRIMDMEVIEDPDMYDGSGLNIIVSDLAHMEAPQRIPINGTTTSFYYNKGLMKGHVKGSVASIHSKTAFSRPVPWIFL